MPTSDDSQPPEPAPAKVAEIDPEFEERRATKKLIGVWSLLEGRFPLVSLFLVIGSVVVTTLAYFLPEPTYARLYADGGGIWIGRKWWALLGSVFIHGGAMHLVFNCYWIWLLGRLLERELGSVRFLCLFLGTALFSSIAELAWAGQLGVGMSGVAYAFFGFLFVNQSRHADFRRILSGNTWVLMLGWLVACFVLTFAKVLNVANFAHLGGLVSGALVGAAWYPQRWQNRARAACMTLGAAALTVLFWAPWQPVWQVGRAQRALIAKDDRAALAALQHIRAKEPGNVWALSEELLIRQARGEQAPARDLLNALVSAQEDTMNLNNLAWFLATCPEAELRDGARAVELARRAGALDGWRSPAIVDTLAAAYAETGDFAEAENWMLKAIEMSGAKSATYQAHLDLIRARTPIRERSAESARAASPERIRAGGA